MMSLQKATVKKEGEDWVVDYESDAVPAIEGKSTKKHPEIKVDIGLKLEPTKVRYPADKYTLSDVVESTKERLDTKECEMCKREQEVVGALVGGLYSVKEQRAQIMAEQQKEVPVLPPPKSEPLFPIFPRPSIVGQLREELEKEEPA